MEAAFERMVPRPRTVASLAAVASAYRLDRKIVVGPRRGVVREVLRRLAREGDAWIGFEATSPLALARELVVAGLLARGLTAIDEFGELELIDEAIGRALDAPGGEALRAFVEGAGLRAAMANSIQALRLAGVEPPVLGRAGFRDRRKREALERVLSEYERLLLRGRKIDAAGVIRHAAEQLAARAITLPDARFFVLPGQSRRGVIGSLLRQLVERGAVVLDDEVLIGLDRPEVLLFNTEDTENGRQTGTGNDGELPTATALACLHAVDRLPPDMPVSIELFAAGSVSDEVREVTRRVVGRGLAWDEVEVIAVDPVAYGTAMDSLARRLGIPVTYAAGLPVSRTRPGRAVDACLRWIRSDLADDVLRDAIERGDIAPPHGGHSTPGPALARRLRSMMIGRSRDRYLTALEKARAAPGAHLEPDHGASAEEVVEAEAHARRVVEDLCAIIEPLLEATPILPDPTDPHAPGVSPAALARGLMAFLRLVPTEPELPATGAAEHDRGIATSDAVSASGNEAAVSASHIGSRSVDAWTKARLIERLERLASVALRPASLEAALSIVAAKLETRVPAPGAAGTSPWSSSGGHLHVSDLEHGGYSGRRVTFVVGLDASRFPGGAPHDTLLGDEERRRLVGTGAFAPIATTAERLQERRWHLARLLARLRGEVTLSYTAWEAPEARSVAPAAEMLQAFRLRDGNAAADYEAMHRALRLATAVPSTTGCLDGSDVWLRALGGEGVMLRGENVVRGAFGDLDAGLRAATLRKEPAFNAHHGRIRPRADLDPRENPDLVVSAQRLETLGTCPLRYLIRYVLRVQPPEDLDWQVDRWLTPLDRGRLLHAVYRRTLRMFAPPRDVDDPALETIALRCLDDELELFEKGRPAPGDAVRGLELAGLREDVLAFVEMTRRLGAPWERLELRFGRGPTAETDAMRIELRGRAIHVAGAIDRIDTTADGFVVIDYKTGGVERFGSTHRAFNGGRRLQHALYTAVARRLVGDVVRAEYHFPTIRGEASVQRFDERVLRKARGIIDALLDAVAAGHFFPTDHADDCRYCDYRTACRVRDDGRETHSPPARWANGTDAAELTLLRKLRRPGV